MTSRKSTKRALILSCISMLLCVSMLVGSTFAWFTDAANTGTNKIEAGTLQVELWEKDSNNVEHNISETQTSVFNYSLWEPGYSDYADLIIKNVGSLALKYQMVFNNIVTSGSADITEVLEVKIGDQSAGTLKQLGQTYILAEGKLGPGTSVNLDRITVTMKTDAGNEYQGCGVSFDVQVRAIQWNKEFDGFGDPNYDINADGTPDYPQFNTTITGVNTDIVIPSGHTNGGNYTYTNGDDSVTVIIPEANPSETYTVNVTPTTATGNVSVASNQGNVSFDISVQKSGTDTPAVIKLKVPANLPNVKLFHDGTEMTAAASEAAVVADTYYYDAVNGIVTVHATSYSNFTLRYEYQAAIGGNVYGTLADAFTAAENGDTVTMLSDIIMSEGIDGTSGQATYLNQVASSITLNMNGHTLGIDPGADNSITGMPMLITVVEGGNLTINGNGKIDVEAKGNGAYGVYLKGGNVTIENGTFTGGPSAVNVKKGVLTINGGNFSCIGGESKYLINCIDADYESGVAVIQIKGGTFKDFNPANVHSETEDPTNFLATGYKASANGDSYVVTESDFYTDADGVWHIRTPQGMQEFKAACEGNQNNGFKGQTIELDCDINMYGQYWAPICGDDIDSYPGYSFKGTFDGNNHIISNLEVVGANNVNSCAGLFGSLSDGAVVKNVILKDSSIRGNHWAGAIAGYVSDGNGATITGCQIENCTITADYYIDSSTVDNGDKAGGIIGYAASGSYTNNTVKNCRINGYRELGGIAGVTNAKSVVVTGNTVDTVTITVFNTHNYKSYADLQAHLTGEIVGNKYSGTVENNTATNITVVAAE